MSSSSYLACEKLVVSSLLVGDVQKRQFWEGCILFRTSPLRKYSNQRTESADTLDGDPCRDMLSRFTHSTNNWEQMLITTYLQTSSSDFLAKAAFRFSDFLRGAFMGSSGSFLSSGLAGFGLWFRSSFSSARLLRQQCRRNIRQNTSLSNRHSRQQFVQLQTKHP